MANIVSHLVRPMLAGSEGEATMKAAPTVMHGAPFVPTLKAILAARTGEAGWLRVRAPLRARHDGTGLKARRDALLRPMAA